MLYIKTSETSGFSWYVGDSIDKLINGLSVRVAQLSADGHELEWLITVIKTGQEVADKQYYKDVWGV